MQREIVCLLLAYGLYYSSRSVLTSASAYFIDIGAITRNVYAIMQTMSYVLAFFTKVTSGYLVKKIGMAKDANARSNRLLLAFASLPILSATSYYVLAATVGLASQYKEAHFALFCAVYCIVKWVSSFSRIFALELAHSFAPSQKALAIINSALQILTCIGDASGKVLMGTMIGSLSIQQIAENRGWKTWAVPIFIIATISVMGVVPLLTMYKRRKAGIMVQRERAKIGTEPFRHTVASLVSNHRFCLCVTISIVNSVVAIAACTYTPHFLRYAVGFSSSHVTTIDAITPVLVIFAITIGNVLLTKFRSSPFRSLYMLFTSGLSLTCIILLLSATNHGIMEVPHWTICAILFAHHAFFFTTQCSIDGAYLMYIVDAARASTAAGIVSGFGYLGAIIVPFTIVNYSTSLDGWKQILWALVFVEALLFALVCTLCAFDMITIKRVLRLRSHVDTGKIESQVYMQPNTQLQS